MKRPFGLVNKLLPLLFLPLSAAVTTIGAWTTHTDPMGFSLRHPPAWKVATDPKLGRVSITGDRGECVVIWPMFMEHRQLNDRDAGVLARQLAAKLEGQMSWSVPKSSGRFVLTSTVTAQRKSAVIMTWANSAKGVTVLL